MKQLNSTHIKKHAYFLLCMSFATAMIISLQCCNKEIGKGELPPVPRRSYLIGNIWGAPVIKSIDSLSTGALINYRGTTADSIIFVWGFDPNIYIYGINSFIGGTNTQYYINRIGQCATSFGYDTATIAYDTIMLAKAWKQDYSDTLFITKTSPTQLVFRVRYSNSVASGIEIDTFWRVGHF